MPNTGTDFMATVDIAGAFDLLSAEQMFIAVRFRSRGFLGPSLLHLHCNCIVCLPASAHRLATTETPSEILERQ